MVLQGNLDCNQQQDFRQFERNERIRNKVSTYIFNKINFLGYEKTCQKFLNARIWGIFCKTLRVYIY